MVRVQIYLSEEEIDTIDQAERETGLSRSQLIRNAIDRIYLAGRDRKAVLQAVTQSAGAWSCQENGAEYVEKRRRGRLSQLYMKDDE